MKVGVPVFSYSNFESFSRRLDKFGYYTTNLGDNMQSIAVRRLLRRIGYSENKIISIDRDSLPFYSGPDVAMIMNGVFPEWSFPIPSSVFPIFLGISVSGSVIDKHIEYFKRFQPIGCRDVVTKDRFIKRDIEAYVSGCLTLTLAKRSVVPTGGKAYVVYGAQVGKIPEGLLQYAPKETLRSLGFVSQRLPYFSFPLSMQQCLEVERYAESLLNEYQESASLIITSLHHAAAPCMALGIPVILAREDDDPRFSYLKSLIPLYTPSTFSDINWDPAACDVSVVKYNLASDLERRLDAAMADFR